MMHLFCRCWGFLFLLAALAGCAEPSETAQVSGTVTVASQPLPGGLVSFFPSGGGRPIGATVDASGKYTVELPPTDYAVVVQVSTRLPDGWQEGDPVPPPAVQLPVQYTQPMSSPLSLSIEAGEPIAKDFQLE